MPWEAPPQTYLSGNTAGTTHVFGPVVTLVGGANVTLSGSGNQIVIKGGAGGAGGTGPSISAGTQSTDGGTVKFADSNGITFGMSGSSQITATVKTDYLTTARASTDAVGLNTAQTGVVWTVNSSGISFDAGAYLTTARRSTDAVGLNTAQTGVVWTVNSSGISFDAGAYLTTARRSTDAIGLNTAATAVTWTVNSSGLSLDAGGYLTTARRSTDAVGLNTAKTAVTWTVNSSGISFDAGAYLTTARASTDAIGLNTAKTNVTWTVNSSGLSFDAGGYLTTARGSTDAIGLNTAKTNVTWTANSSGLSLNAGGYAGTVTGATNCSVTANTAGVSVNVPAGAGTSISYHENPSVGIFSSWSGTSNSISVQRVFVPASINATRADFALFISGSSSAGLSLQVNLGLYTASQSTLNSVSTTSRGLTFNSTSAVSYTNVSGPRSWSVGLGTWVIVPGEYFLAANFGWTTGLTNTVSLNMYGGTSGMPMSGAETAALGNVTNYFRSGMRNSQAASVLPATMQLVDMTQTGAVFGQQPWFGFHGTF